MTGGITINKWLRWGYALFLGIVFNFVLDMIFSLVYTNYSLFQPYTNYLTSVLLTYVVFECLFFVNGRLNKKYGWDSNPYWRFVFQVALNSAIAVFLLEGLRWGFMLLTGNAYYIRLLDELIIIGLVLSIVLVFTIMELSVYLLNSWRFSLAELERFKKENAEFRFESLRSQLNPHFLFNSLNTLSALVYEDTEKAGLFIRELSDVYRHILENRDVELVQLSEELDFAQSYIHLIQLRFGKNINVVADMNNINGTLCIAPLTLQLLIENAVKHNVISRKHPLRIDIFIYRDMLVVKNNLQPKESKGHGNKMGLKNIKSRYGFLTDRIVEVSENGKEFIVKIPLIQSPAMKLNSK